MVDVQNIGYCPDTFGHVAQMPQILREAEIDNFIYGRGLGDEYDDLSFQLIIIGKALMEVES